MAGEDEVLIRFSGNDEQLAQVAQKTESRLKGLGSVARTSSDTDFKKMFDTDAANRYGSAVEGLESKHFSARRGISVLAASTGIVRSELTHLYHGMMMFGGPVGALVAGLMATKSAVDEGVESYKRMREVIEQTDKTIAASAERHKVAARGGEMGKAAKEEYDALSEQIKELQKKKTEEYNAAWFKSRPELKESQANYDTQIDKLKQAQREQFMGYMQARESGEQLLDIEYERHDLEMQVTQYNKNSAEYMRGSTLLAEDREAAQAKYVERLRDSGERGSVLLAAEKQLRAYQLDAHKARQAEGDEAKKKKMADWELQEAPDVNLNILIRTAEIEHSLAQRKFEEEKSYRNEVESLKKQSRYSEENAKTLEEFHLNRLKRIELESAEEVYQFKKQRTAELRAYRNEELSAVKGQELAAYVAAKNKMEVDMEEARRRNDSEMESAAYGAGMAKMGKLGQDARYTLAGRQVAGFSGVADFWKQFGSTAREMTPAEREHLKALRELVVISQAQVEYLKAKRKEPAVLAQ